MRGSSGYYTTIIFYLTIVKSYTIIFLESRVLSKGGQMRGFISARLSLGISALYVFGK